MKIRGREITKRMAVFMIVALAMIGIASAALVSYVGSSMHADLTVSAADYPVTTSAISRFEALPENVPAGDWSGSLALVSASGDGNITTVRIANTGAPIANVALSASLGYFDNSGTNLDPNNCGDLNADGDNDITTGSPEEGSYTGIAGTCLGYCTGGLCIDGSEFSVLGLRTYNEAAHNWWPNQGAGFGYAAFPDQASCEAWSTTFVGVPVTGYWNTENSACFANYVGLLSVASFAQNPFTIPMTPTGESLPTGNLYGQLLLKTTLDPATNVQIAPGVYSVDVTVQ
jgi:hypothetical protein